MKIGRLTIRGRHLDAFGCRVLFAIYLREPGS